MISLGIDIGGTDCKCVAFPDTGEQLASAYTEYPLTAGQVDLPPDILQSTVFQVIACCTAQLADSASAIVCLFGKNILKTEPNKDQSAVNANKTFQKNKIGVL